MFFIRLSPKFLTESTVKICMMSFSITKDQEMKGDLNEMMRIAYILLSGIKDSYLPGLGHRGSVKRCKTNMININALYGLTFS